MTSDDAARASPFVSEEITSRPPAMTDKSSPIPSNSAELARRFRSVTIWIYVCIALIPLGLVVPCVVAAAVQPFAPDISPWIALSALLWPLVGLAGALLRLGDRRRAKRGLELAKLAETWKMQFFTDPVPKQFADLATFQLLLQPTFMEGKNLFVGAFQSSRLRSLDYEFAYQLGSMQFVGKQTVVVLEDGFERLPDFAVVPRTWVTRLENAVLGKAYGQVLELPSQPEFSRFYSVAGSDPQQILRRLSPEVVQYFLQDKSLTLEVNAGRILVFRRETYLREEEYGAFLRNAASLALALAR